MGGIGDVLELLHGAGKSWSTARFALRAWGDSELARRAMLRHAQAARSWGATAVVSGRGDGPSTWESTVRAWVDRAGERRRIETTDGHGERLTVSVGELWWSYTPLTGAISNQNDLDARNGGGNEHDWLLDPWAVVPALTFELAGTAVVAGREALVVRAVPRPLDSRLGFAAHLAQGADEVALAIDRERGALLRCESRFDGQPYSRYEITEIGFDEPLADEVFRFVPPDGSRVRSPREAYANPEPASIEEAARRASFTVLVPTRLPRGWAVDVLCWPPVDRPPRPESVTLNLRPEDRLAPRVRIHQSAMPTDDRLDWEAVDHGGRRILLHRHNGAGATWEAKVERRGTHVRATGDVEREAMLEIVASLEPAPRELPPME